jgi:hypothetical protein
LRPYILNFFRTFLAYFFWQIMTFFFSLIYLYAKKMIKQPKVTHLILLHHLFLELFNHSFIVFNKHKIINIESNNKMSSTTYLFTNMVGSFLLFKKHFSLKWPSIWLYQALRACFNL